MSIAPLLAAPRIKIVAKLAPLAGTRFQPTGFPDLGAATYPSPTDPDTTLLLVESVQSMANRLESQLWPVGSLAPAGVADGLPYVRVASGTGEYLTSSRTESHRLASAYVKDADFNGVKGLNLIGERLGLAKNQPMDHAKVHRAIYALDPLCLLHGVFFADNAWPGQPKIARAVSAFVEAEGAQEAYSGGVKFDHVSNAGDKEDGKGAGQGFGNVPFPRTEYVARSITAYFVIDTSQIRRYHLERSEQELLLALALFEIRSLLDEGLRLRTACDLEVVDEPSVERPAGATLPDQATLEGWVRERIRTAQSPLDGVYAAKPAKAGKKEEVTTPNADEAPEEQ
jgi:CRISPR-associated protein Csb1